MESKALKSLIIVCGMGSIGILVSSPAGSLTVAGVVSCIAIVGLVLLEEPSIALLIAALTVAGSLTAQWITAFCIPCSICGCLIAVMGLSSLILAKERAGAKSDNTVIIMSLLVLVAAFIFITVEDYTGDSGKGEESGFDSKIAVDSTFKPRLYFSEDCGVCEVVLQKYSKADPEGECWEPVLVGKGSDIVTLREYGYTGKVRKEEESPSGLVPCIEVRQGEVYNGAGAIVSKLSSVVKVSK